MLPTSLLVLIVLIVSTILIILACGTTIVILGLINISKTWGIPFILVGSSTLFLLISILTAIYLVQKDFDNRLLNPSYRRKLYCNCGRWILYILILIAFCGSISALVLSRIYTTGLILTILILTSISLLSFISVGSVILSYSVTRDINYYDCVE